MDGGGWQHNHDQYEQLTIWLGPTSIKKHKKHKNLLNENHYKSLVSFVQLVPETSSND